MFATIWRRNRSAELFPLHYYGITDAASFYYHDGSDYRHFGVFLQESDEGLSILTYDPKTKRIYRFRGRFRPKGVILLQVGFCAGDVGAGRPDGAVSGVFAFDNDSGGFRYQVADYHLNTPEARFSLNIYGQLTRLGDELFVGTDNGSFYSLSLK